MRKTLLFAGALLFSFFAQAQNFHLEEANNPNEIYLSGDVVEVGEIGDIVTEAGFFSFKVRNKSENTIQVQAKLIEVVNGLPEEESQALQFCFTKDCYENIIIDRVYPIDGQYIKVLAGETHREDSFDHIVNFYEPTDGGVVDYTFRFFEVEVNAEDVVVGEIGEPLLLTYRYNPTLSTPDFNADFALLKSTILKDAIDIELDRDAALTMYDMLGREVLNRNLTSGAHHIALPNLSSNLYFIQLGSKEGAKQTIKVLVE